MDISQTWMAAQELIDSFLRTLPQIVLAIIVFGLFYLAAAWVKTLVNRFTEAAGASASAGKVLGRLARWLVIGGGLLVSLNIALPGFTTGELVQLLGISSVAIGFAFHDILQNFLAGILILLTEPFTIGDEIVVNDFEGEVEDIQTRATAIRTYDGRRIVIPNANLFTESVTVNTAFPIRRSEYAVGIGYGDDVTEAMRLMMEVMEGAEGVLVDPAPDVLVSELGDFSVNLRARWWTDSERSNVLEVQSEVISAIKERLLAHGIDLPFPTQQVLFHDQTEVTDGDRRLQREGWPAGKGAVPGPRGAFHDKGSRGVSPEEMKETD